MTATWIETLMYDVAQLFLLPTLALIALTFAYAFWALGEFISLVWQRRRGGGRPLLAAWHARPELDDDTLDLLAHTLLERPRLASRVAPMLGLVATMIPMGPALKSLSDGQLGQVSQSLMVAFSAVILALIAASITYGVAQVRRRWLAEELLDVAAQRRQPTGPATA